MWRGSNKAEVKGKQAELALAQGPSSPLTLVHFLIQLNLKGSSRLLNPGVVQTSLEVPIFGFLNLPS